MSYGSINDVRALTNLTANDISDADLTALMAIAQRMFFNDVLMRIEREEITYSRTSPTTLIYQLSHYPIASVENGLNPTAGDIVVEALNINANDLSNAIRQIQVQDLNAGWGLIQLAEAPQPHERLFATYYAAPVSFNSYDIDAAVNFLTAHLATLRIQDPGTIQVADFNNALVVKDKKMETRFLEMYERKKNEILMGATFRAVDL